MSTVPPSAGGPTPLGPSQDPRSANQDPGASQQGAPGASPLPYSDQPTSVLPPASAPYQGAPQGGGAPGSPYQGGYPPQSNPGAQQNGYAPTAQQGGYGAPDYGQGAPYGQPGPGDGGPRAPKKNTTAIIIGAIVAVLVVAGAGFAVYWFGFRGSSDPSAGSAPTASAPASPGAPSAGGGAPSAGGSPSAAPTSSSGGGSSNGGSASQGQPGNMTGDLSGVKVSIDAVERGPKDDKGKDTVVLTMTATNNTSEDQSTLTSNPLVFQGGESFENALTGASYPSGGEPHGYSIQDALQIIKPGKSATWKMGYSLNQGTGEIIIKLLDYTDPSKSMPSWKMNLP